MKQFQVLNSIKQLSLRLRVEVLIIVQGEVILLRMYAKNATKVTNCKHLNLNTHHNYFL